MLQPKDIEQLNGYKNKKTYIYCLQETCFRSEYIHRLKVRGWKMYSMQKAGKKNLGIAILRSDIIDFETKTAASCK